MDAFSWFFGFLVLWFLVLTVFGWLSITLVAAPQHRRSTANCGFGVAESDGSGKRGECKYAACPVTANTRRNAVDSWRALHQRGNCCRTPAQAAAKGEDSIDWTGTG